MGAGATPGSVTTALSGILPTPACKFNEKSSKSKAVPPLFSFLLKKIEHGLRNY